MTEAAETYTRMVRATEEQRRRIGQQPGFDRWDATAARFRVDPRRALDPNLAAIASYLQPDDVLIDVGGGAGRYGLPLALRCREVINVEPSQGMGREFEASAREAGIANARLVLAAWGSAPEVAGDVSLVSNVTYFVPDIVPFIERLNAATRRRVIIANLSIPTPNQAAGVFRALHGEDLAPVPGHRELLPVLWDLGLLPDVRVLGPTERQRYASREDAIEAALRQSRLADDAQERARRNLTASFDETFEAVEGGYIRRTPAPPRMMLITWEPR